MEFNVSIFGDGFTAMAIRSMDEVQDCRGATGGLFEPTDIAEKYCGMQNFCTGDIMAYGFRRWGYPVNGWDGNKQLCHWIVTTPMNGVFLTVTPRNVAPFGYLLKKPLEKEFMDEREKPRREWARECSKWAKDQGVILFDYFHPAGQRANEEIENEFNGWFHEAYPGGDIEKVDNEIVKIFTKEKSEECHRYAEEYDKICPMPRVRYPGDPESTGIPYWESLPSENLERRINEALCRTIFDLRRPVWVRDWQLFFEYWEKPKHEFVQYDSYGDEIYNYFAPTSDMAGYGLAYYVDGGETCQSK